MIKLSTTIERTVTLDTSIKKAYLIDIAIAKSQTAEHDHREAPKVYRLERRPVRVWQLTSAYKTPLVLTTTGNIPNKLHESLIVLQLHSGPHILM
jgi:hypothetical protein